MFIKTVIDYVRGQRPNMLVLQEVIVMTPRGKLKKKKKKKKNHEVKNNLKNSKAIMNYNLCW